MLFGGIHPTIAPIRNILKVQGVLNPYTQQPFTEAMLLGIAGGLGAGYLLSEAKNHQHPHLVLGFINHWNDVLGLMNNMLSRIDGAGNVAEFTSKKRAELALLDVVNRQPVMAWVDKAYLPHWQLPDRLKGTMSHVVGVYSADKHTVLVDDLLSKELLNVPASTFMAGRERITSHKSRLMTITLPKRIKLVNAIQRGLEDQVSHLSDHSASCALSAFKKWAQMVTDTKSKKGWHTIFPNGQGVLDSLVTIYQSIVLDGTDGGAMRYMYADFLMEAAPILEKTALEKASKAYRHAGNAWVAVAQAALPTKPYKRAKTLLNQRYSGLKDQKPDEVLSISHKWESLRDTHNATNPLSAEEASALFAHLSAKIETAFEAEEQALAVLKDSI